MPTAAILFSMADSPQSSLPFASKSKPPDLSLSSKAPSSPSADSGYRTGGSCRLLPEILKLTTVFNFPSHNDDDDDCDSELEDDVFMDNSQQEMNSDEEEQDDQEVAVMPRRSRAFSFPFTLADVHFATGDGRLQFSGLTLIQRRQFGSRFVVPGGVDLPWPRRENSAAKIHNKIGDDFLDQIDESNSPHLHVPSKFSSKSSLHSPSPQQSIPLISGSRLLALPDLVLSGAKITLHQRRTSHPDTPDSCVSHENMELQIARRLARIGDEFDIGFFAASAGVGSDSPDSAQTFAGVSFSTASKLWHYLTKSSNVGRNFVRQRSHSTAD